MAAETQTLHNSTVTRGAGPAWTLVFLAPFIAEVLSGATHVSVIFALVPEMMVWGCGTLLIRDLVRRWGGGWPSLLMFGLGLSIAEEFVIQQTSLAPLPFPGVAATYGRAWGVNWIYFLFMLAFESVLVVLVPIQVTELIFAKRSAKPWLRTRGMIIATVIFLLGSRMAWYAWIKRVRPMIFHLPPYHPSPLAIGGGVLAIALLALEAFLIRGIGHTVPSRSTPSAWVVGVVTCVLGAPWYWLMKLQFTAHPEKNPPWWVAIAALVLWGAVAYGVFRRWTASPQWNGLHNWAGAFAATLLCMSAGFLGSSTWSRLDLIGKAVLNVIAVAGFLWLLQRMRDRSAT